jgi:aromatic ring-cleaving dioxygenase
MKEWQVYENLIEHIGYTFEDELTMYGDSTSILIYNRKFTDENHRHHQSQIRIWIGGDGSIKYFKHKDSISILKDPITGKEAKDWVDQLRILCLPYEKKLREFKLEYILNE